MSDMHPGEEEVFAPLVPLTDAMVHDQVAGLDHAAQKAFVHLLRFGFSQVQALRLARAGAPWARVERALLAGCTFEQALEIWT